MIAATTATATTASAVVILMSRSVTGPVPRASRARTGRHRRSRREPFREHHRRDGLVPGEQAARVARDDPGAVTVGRWVFAQLRGRDHAVADLQGHGVVVDHG